MVQLCADCIYIYGTSVICAAAPHMYCTQCAIYSNTSLEAASKKLLRATCKGARRLSCTKQGHMLEEDDAIDQSFSESPEDKSDGERECVRD